MHLQMVKLGLQLAWSGSEAWLPHSLAVSVRVSMLQ